MYGGIKYPLTPYYKYYRDHPIEKCCTDFSCDNETLPNGKSVKCCSLAELKNEQKISKENQNCSPCWKCSKFY